VFSVEPPAPDHPLLRLPNVIATPHIGGNTVDVAAHQGRIVAEELERMARGEAPRHALNPATLAGFRWSEPRPAPDPAIRQRLRRRAGPAVTDLQKKPAPARPAAGAQPRGDSKPMPVKENMTRLLGAFVDAIVADPALQAFAGNGQDVTLHFIVSDLDAQFFFGFEDGGVHGGLGAPASGAGVQLEMKADLLDGMFTGRKNAMQAAMAGELSFSGDTAKAMTLTHVNADLSRLYRAVREKLGDPGDLTALAGPAAAPAAAAPAARPSAAAADDPRHQIVQIVNELYAAQLITATGGNVSARARIRRRPGSPRASSSGRSLRRDPGPSSAWTAGRPNPGRARPSEALMHTVGASRRARRAGRDPVTRLGDHPRQTPASLPADLDRGRLPGEHRPDPVRDAGDRSSPTPWWRRWERAGPC
jgi:autoinducer 2 (AI-2) kinase